MIPSVFSQTRSNTFYYKHHEHPPSSSLLLRVILVYPNMCERLPQDIAHRANIEVDSGGIERGEAVLRLSAHFSVFLQQSRALVRRNDAVIVHRDVPHLAELRHGAEEESPHERRRERHDHASRQHENRVRESRSQHSQQNVGIHHPLRLGAWIQQLHRVLRVDPLPTSLQIQRQLVLVADHSAREVSSDVGSRHQHYARQLPFSPHWIQLVEPIRGRSHRLHFGRRREHAAIEQIAHSTRGHLSLKKEKRGNETAEAEFSFRSDRDHSLAEDVVELVLGGKQRQGDLLVVLDPEVDLLVLHRGVEDVVDLHARPCTTRLVETDVAGAECGIQTSKPPCSEQCFGNCEESACNCSGFR